MKIITALVLGLTATTALSADYVRGYVRQDGTYVAPHVRSSPDGNPYNNYSTRGNVNPYTGQAGTVDPSQSLSPHINSTPPPSFGITTNPYEIINGR